MLRSGCKLEHTLGRSGRPNIRHWSFSSSCTQRTPAGLPDGMPGMGLEIEGAMQQAPQPARHFIRSSPEPNKPASLRIP
jgi:hypothetical protein